MSDPVHDAAVNNIKEAKQYTFEYEGQQMDWNQYLKHKYGLNDDDITAPNYSSQGSSNKSSDSKPSGNSGWSSGSSWSGSGSGGYAYSKCRHKPTAVFTIGDIYYCGGSAIWCEDEEFEDGYLVVNLLGEEKPLFTTNTKKYEELRPYTNVLKTKTVNIKWPDMRVPPVQKEFWRKLHEIAEKDKIHHVLFYCMGGHGRTGTALASILVTVANQQGDDAIAFVKKHYCKEAIETKEQENYIRLLKESVKA